MTVTIGDGSNGYPINQYTSIPRWKYKELLKEAEVAAHAKKLALALECLLLSCEETAVVSKWWASAHMALGEYQDDIDRLYPQDHVSPLGKD